MGRRLQRLTVSKSLRFRNLYGLEGGEDLEGLRDKCGVEVVCGKTTRVGIFKIVGTSSKSVVEPLNLPHPVHPVVVRVGPHDYNFAIMFLSFWWELASIYDVLFVNIPKLLQNIIDSSGEW